MRTKIEKHNYLSTIAVKHTANLVIKVTIVIDIAVILKAHHHSSGETARNTRAAVG